MGGEGRAGGGEQPSRRRLCGRERGRDKVKEKKKTTDTERWDPYGCNVSRGCEIGSVVGVEDKKYSQENRRSPYLEK
jgi:hypothetical protein